jgi:hypothetical protein
LSFYPDSSFVISLYVPDENAAAAVAAMRTVRGEGLITPLAELEVTNALEQRVFRKEDSASRARRSLRWFEQDLEANVFHRVDLPESLFVRAREVALRTTSTLGTRAIDLLHVAAALELGVSAFYSFDERQRRLAKLLKLKLNPVP